MTTPRDQRAQTLNALAAVIHAIRPDWDPPGIVAALRRITETVPLPAIVIAAGRYVADSTNLTPAHLADLGNRAWDSDGYPPCPTHPTAGRRASGECGGCYADRTAAQGPPAPRAATPPPKPLRQLVADTRPAPDAEACPVSERTLDG
jgi:hypothetical protein